MTSQVQHLLEHDLDAKSERRAELGHVVHFYENDEHLARVVASFLCEGLSAGERAIVIATPAHRRLIVGELLRLGADVTPAEEGGRLVLLDAEETLARFMAGAMPDEERFDRSVGALFDVHATIKTRAYGEMVDVLWREGNAEGAIRLEELWNGLRERHAFSLLCAYVVASFYKQTGDMARVCEVHGGVWQPNGREAGADGDGGGESRSLLAEIAKRREIEVALRESLLGLRRTEALRKAAAERTSRLMKVTAAIAAAVTESQIYEALVERVADALEATTGGLWRVDPETGIATLVRSLGYTDKAKRVILRTSLDSRESFPALDAIRDNQPLWIASQAALLERYPHLADIVISGRDYEIASLPLCGAEERPLGSLVLTFEGRPPLDDEVRDLLILVARYAAQALERLRLLESERRSRAVAEASAARQAFLSRAQRRFSEAGENFDAVLQAIVGDLTADIERGDDPSGSAVAPFVEGGILMLLSPRGDTLELAAMSHRVPEATALARALVEAAPGGMTTETGGSAAVVRTGKPLVMNDASLGDLLALSRPEGREWVQRYAPRHVAVLPLRARQGIIGSLAALRQDGAPPFSDEDLSLLQDLSDRAALALETSRLAREKRAALARAELLYDLAGSVIRAQGLEQVFEAALVTLERALEAPRSAILIFDDEDVMRFRAFHGLSDEYRAAVEGHSPWSRDETAPQPLFIGDVETDAAMEGYLPVFQKEGIRALGFVPLVAGGELIGKFMVYYDEPRELSAHEIHLASAIANHVAAAVVRFSITDELQQTARFHEMFTGILGHDLRNPLSAIMMAAELVKKRAPEERLAKAMDRMLTSGARMSRMIDQLLDFTRVRVGDGIPLARLAVDVASILRDVIDELKAANPSSVLHFEHQGKTAGTFDADRLAQVFSNLIANAVQHGAAERGVAVRVDGTRPDRVEVTVHNMGSVSPDLLPRLFKPMAGGVRRRDGSQGLGLGLYISQEIVKAHGGHIAVTSTSKSGTTFTVSLPRCGV